jgi:transposase
MLSQEDYIVIRTLKKRGVYHKDIAAELGVHPRTVSRALQRGSAPQRERKRRASKLDKLDPYKATVDRLLAEGVWNGVVILREIQAQGYEGGHTILRDYIQPKRAQRQSRATVRFETPPGRQLQSDWGEITTEIAGVETKVCFMVNTLGYSRRFHFWCTDRMDAEHTYEGLIRSFEYFGGVPEEVLVDNQKTAVLEHRAGAAPQFNPRFVDLAGYYGFRPRACQPYRARTKGKDERMVGYLKQHFFVRYRAFDSWMHLNQVAEQWLRTEADPRLHGTVKEIVAARFEREAPALQPLPKVRYDTAYIERRQCHFTGENVPENFTQSGPGVFTETVPVMFSQNGPGRWHNSCANRILPLRRTSSSGRGYGKQEERQYGDSRDFTPPAGWRKRPSHPPGTGDAPGDGEEIPRMGGRTGAADG